MCSQLQYKKMSNFRKDGDDRHFLIYHHPCRHLVTILQPYTVDTFSLYDHSSSICRYQCEGDKLFPFLHYQNYYVPKAYFTLYIIPYLFTPSWFPFRALRTNGLSGCLFHHPLFPKFFFSLSARGPTRRRNSTGLAELWGGWPIERASWSLNNFFTFVCCKHLIVRNVCKLFSSNRGVSHLN